ncbi:HalOD1 output domain-containing protein [Halovivax gelatinilyticus]|uniref:HalOD1 output domain-containing protein n=1 Tax=Halovivax gelatinilyticus TaxID=2961597 RepID=UPI0020CA9BB8|nr:HalOD1 output domain-containing protein [Halovivax gelatinilyticus]
MFADPDHSIAIDGSHTFPLSPDQTATQGVLSAISSASGRPLLPDDSNVALPPLYDAIDPEALDAIFEFRDGDRPDVTLSFEYGDCRVTVSSNEITIDGSE